MLMRRRRARPALRRDRAGVGHGVRRLGQERADLRRRPRDVHEHRARSWAWLPRPDRPCGVPVRRLSRDELARVPATAVESFAGVGYPFAANVIRAGDTVLDIGSGSGTDVFLAQRAVGPPAGHRSRPHHRDAREAGLEHRYRGPVEDPGARGERRAAPPPRCFGGCRHEQRRAQSRPGQAGGLCGDPPRAEAGWTPADRRHCPGPPPLRRLRLRSPGLGGDASWAPRRRTSISPS